MTRGLEQLVKGWKKGDLPPVYVFVGPDRFSHAEAVHRLRGELAVRAEMRREEVEVVTFRGGDVQPESALEALTDVSLFSRVKLIVLTEVGELPTEAWKRLHSELQAHFGAAQPAPPAAPLLVLTSSEPNVRRDRGPSRLDEFVKKAKGTVRIEFPAPTPQELPGVLSKMAEERGLSLPLPVARRLAGRAGGTELRHYDNELAKLETYAHPNRTIDASMVDAVSARSADEVSPYLIFDLAESIVEGRTAQVLDSVRRLLKQGETPVGIVAMLARHIRQLRRAADFSTPRGGRAPGADAGGLAKELGVPPFVAKKLVSQARRVVPERLDDALLLCAETDGQLKRATDAVPYFEAMMFRVTVLFAP